MRGLKGNRRILRSIFERSEPLAGANYNFCFKNDNKRSFSIPF
ncbi:hypothetical protein GGE67_004250 [Rhizobium leucaenae]|nr:hypothetical protein [Rhizobium leucaenae]